MIYLFIYHSAKEEFGESKRFRYMLYE